MIRIVFLWVTLEGRFWRESKSIRDIDFRFLKLKQSRIFQKVFDALLLLLDHNTCLLRERVDDFRDRLFLWRKGIVFRLWCWFVPAVFFWFPFKDWRIVTRISTYMIVQDNYISFLFHLVAWGLYGVISALFALSFVELTNNIYLSNDFSINIHSRIAIELFFFEHGQVQHFVLNF